MASTFRVNISDSVKVLRLADSPSDPSKLNPKEFLKLWAVLSSHLPGEGSLQFFTSKSDVKHSPALFVENVTDMMDVSHMGYNKKQKILQLTFSDHLIFLQFSSAATMQQWNGKLKDYLNCYPLFLLKCPQHPDWKGHYIVCYNNNDLSVYSTQSNRLEWTWSINHLRRYCFEPKIPFVEIESGRSSSTGEGNFFFTGARSEQLFKLLESLSASARPVRLLPSRSMDMLSDAGTSCNSKSLDIPGSAQITDSNGYLKVVPNPTCHSLSPRGNRKFMMDNRSLSGDDAVSLYSQHSTNGFTEVDHPAKHRPPPKMISAASVDEESVFPKFYAGPRRSTPDAHQVQGIKSLQQTHQMNSKPDGSYSYSARHSPLLSLVENKDLDFNAFDSDDDDSDGYINDDELHKIIPAMKNAVL